MKSVSEEVRRLLPHEVKAWTRSMLEKANRLVGMSDAPAAQAEPAPAPAPQQEPPPPDLSQSGEVATLSRLLRQDFPRFLVDVGAHDGVTISNSRQFALDGWDAIMIEPHPGLFAKLADANSDLARVRCLNIACSNKAGVLPLFLGKNDPQNTMSTLCTDENPWFHSFRSGESVMVSVKTLTEVLSESGWPRDLSLLMVDAEGMDHEVLLGLDFEQYRPRIIVTEDYIFNPEKHRNKYKLLLDRDYTFHSMVGSNTIWIANECVDACLGLESAAVTADNQPPLDSVAGSR